MLSVGEVAAELGVSASTVRMWGTRYGLSASARSPGGHRRYSAADVARLRRMQAAVVAGEDPAGAAARVTGHGSEADASPRAASPRRRGGPGGAVLAVPGGGAAARGLARAASRLDDGAAQDAVAKAIAELGVVAAWDDVVSPVLVAAGRHWARTRDGIAVEHVLTQALITALARHQGAERAEGSRRPVLLAGGPREDHVLALHAARAALAERGVPARLLGPRVPLPALAAAARRLRAPAVLVWQSRRHRSLGEGLAEVAAAHRRSQVFLGGPGWSERDMVGATWCPSLLDATRRLADASARS